MTERLKKYTSERPRLKKTVGGVLVFLGFIALITPFTPGAFIMLGIGLEFLGFRMLFLERAQNRVFKRREFPLEG
jgi:hypothetical protein